MRNAHTTLLLLFLFLSRIAFAQSIPDAATFLRYMKGQALTWDTISTDYYTGAILG